MQKGSPAKFSWQTILILRVAVLLRDRFQLELQAHKTSFARLKSELRTRSFVTLWGHSLALSPNGGWTLVEGDTLPADDDVLLIRLDPHLRILRDGFALPDLVPAPGQLDLFSLAHTRRNRQSQAPRPSSAARRQSA
jgi:hypothetical protein